MAFFQILFLLTILATTSHGSSESTIPHQIHLLRPQSGSSGHHVPGASCLSWRLGVEMNNIIGWKTVPEKCEGYVGHYMLGHQYRKDSKAVIEEAFRYVESLKLDGDGKDVWVFDIDETTLSNLPYYAHHGFGMEVFNATMFNKWVLTGKAPALPESLSFYKKLVSLGIKIVFITGRAEDQRIVTTNNLKKAGYRHFMKLILKAPLYTGKTAVMYKSNERAKLESKGYRVIGNMGDQWSDILGTNTGNRTFKLPDPMYYIS
ncbi:acid phosphatase 1-like [Mercurialis annua]|uniref:acid phosphatase 1-like n=1 Tax=Mercurialis annua TaxID=3986 RepID=UPI00215FBCF3|nr:acid phosphatase 1-like [Mercurialis annua]